MATTIAGYVDDLHSVNLFLRVNADFRDLPIFGKDIVCKFLARCTA